MTINNETRQKILDVAFRLFGTYGFEGVSTMEIAETAGVNKALIFYYFGSKKDLYSAAFRKMRDSFFERISGSAVPHTSELEYIESFIRGHISFLRETPEMVNFLIRELVSAKAGSSLILEDLADVFRMALQNLGDAVEEGIENGEIRKVDPVQTVLSIISLDVFFFLQKTLMSLLKSEYLPDVSSVDATREDHIIDLVMNGIRTKGKT